MIGVNSLKGESLLANAIDNIHRDLLQLRGPILTIYLNTHPSLSDWKIRLKNGLKRTKEYIAVSSAEESDVFSKISKTVEQKIQDKQTSLTNSFICFASSDRILLYLLQVPVQNDFQWADKQADAQLNELLAKYPKSGIIILQHEKVTLITSLLGEVIHERNYFLNLETNQWKQDKRYKVSYHSSNGSNHRDKYVKRFREHQARWFKSIIPEMIQFCRVARWEKVYLAGPTELRNIVKKHLNIHVTGETARNYSGKPAHKILNQTILSRT